MGPVGGPHGLAAQGTALGRRGGLNATDTAGWVVARVEGRGAGLAVVHPGRAGPVAAGDIQRPVRAEFDAAHRVGEELLAPIVEEHLFGADHVVPAGLKAGQPAADHAAVLRAGWAGAAVTPAGSGAAD